METQGSKRRIFSYRLRWNLASSHSTTYCPPRWDSQRGSPSTSRHNLTSLKLTDSEFFIPSVTCVSLSLTTSRHRSRAPSPVSPGRGATSIRYSRSKDEMTATNSTCENFFPGHTRAPADHGMNAFLALAGSTRLSDFKVSRMSSVCSWLGDSIQRAGRQSRWSSPQYPGYVPDPITLGAVMVFGGTKTLRPSITTRCPWDPTLALFTLLTGW